jgi:hypothetical protein
MEATIFDPPFLDLLPRKGCPLLTARLPRGTGVLPLPLLPSGPDGVHGSALHGT